MKTSLKSLRIPALALCVGLSAGWAFAAPKKDKPSIQPTPAPKITKRPTTCKDQCDLMAQMCAQPCADPKRKNSKAQCEKSCDKMVAACDGSCQEKGRIDAKYMKDHLKPPSMPEGGSAED